MCALSLKYGKKVSLAEFNAFCCYARHPSSVYIYEEVEWFSFFNRKIFATIVRTIEDKTLEYVVFGRDADRIFRCISCSGNSYKTLLSVRKDLSHFVKFEILQKKIKSRYLQGDEIYQNIDLFMSSLVPKEKQHEFYSLLINEPKYEAARYYIKELANPLIDLDGSFAKEFQSRGFNARLFELYLTVYFYHNPLMKLIRAHDSPDFEIEVFGKTFFVEATTINNSDINDDLKNRSNSDYQAVRYNRVIHNKIKKKYPSLPHVNEKPFIIAVHDYHYQHGVPNTYYALLEYLYGIKFTKCNNGQEYLKKNDKHDWKNKEIPSGLFYQADTDQISAILYSNQATIPKFTRMGYLANLGSRNFEITRWMKVFDSSEGVSTPLTLVLNINDPTYCENWSDGIILFHNPKAKHPIGEIEPFPFRDVTNYYFRSGELIVEDSVSEKFHIYNSFTSFKKI